ncbi:MAG: HD domain-containing protein [Methanotrichaceae archaeon]
MIKEANVLLPSYHIGLSNLASYLSSDKKSLEKMIFISCALHDAGKLSTQWQSAMMAWQNISDPFAEQFVKGMPLAHTTYDPRADWKRLQDSKLHQGPHAAEGAYASLPIIHQASCVLLDANQQEVAIACMAAIARHHGPRTSSLQEFTHSRNR